MIEHVYSSRDVKAVLERFELMTVSFERYGKLESVACMS